MAVRARAFWSRGRTPRQNYSACRADLWSGGEVGRCLKEIFYLYTFWLYNHFCLTFVSWLLDHLSIRFDYLGRSSGVLVVMIDENAVPFVVWHLLCGTAARSTLDMAASFGPVMVHEACGSLLKHRNKPNSSCSSCSPSGLDDLFHQSCPTAPPAGPCVAPACLDQLQPIACIFARVTSSRGS